MAAKLTRLTDKIVIQLHLVSESCTIYSSHSRQPVRVMLLRWLWISSWSLLNMYYYFLTSQFLHFHLLTSCIFLSWGMCSQNMPKEKMLNFTRCCCYNSKAQT